MRTKIAAIQFQPITESLEKNLKKISRLVNEAAEKGAKIIVLPEICELGYDMALISKNASVHPNEATALLSKIAKDHKIVLAAGLAEKRGEDLYNTCTVFGCDGEIIAKYDKSHLCVVPPYDEPRIFKYGERIFTQDATINGEKIKLGFSICFDIRFPEIYRKLALEGAELILHPTAFPMMRIEQFEVCSRARTIENQFYFASANFCGTTGGIELGGNSLIIGPEGKVLAKAGRNSEETIIAEIDTSNIAISRKERPVFSCRRPEIY